MSAPHIIPLMTIPSALSQAMATSVLYREAANTLLENTYALDGLLGTAIIVEPGDDCDAYLLDRSQYNYTRAHALFVKIREQREAMQAQLPLLNHVENLVDYIAHVTTNVVYMTDRQPRLIAEVSKDRRSVAYHNIDSPTYERSLALYMGLSPLPIFGTNIPHDDDSVTRQLAVFGFGAFTYLYLICHPDALQNDHLPPELLYQNFLRPIAAPPLYWQADGSLSLSSP